MRQMNIFRRKKPQNEMLQQEIPLFELPNFGKPAGKYDAVIHIGTPGTGSAAIQKFLFDNHSRLNDLGFYYPIPEQSNNAVSHGHSKLGRYLEKNDLTSAKSLFDGYLAEAKQNRLTLLLSAKSLYGYPNILKELTLEKKCKIIAFFKDPLESLFSNYNQAVKDDFVTTTFERFCHDIASSENDCLSGKVFNQWQDCYSRQNLLVLGYDPSVFEKIRIEMLFLAGLGIDKNIFDTFQYTEGRINPSLSFLALELRRLLNFVIAKDLFYYNQKIDWLLQNYSEQLAKVVIREHIPEELYFALRDKFKQTNRHLLDEILTKINPDFLVADNDPPKEQTVARAQYDDSQLKNILEIILENDATTKKYVIHRTTQALSSKGGSYYVLRLADLLGIDIHPYINTSSYITTKPLFSKEQMNIFLSKTAQPADFLREIAITLEHHDDYKSALLLVERGLELRPNGRIMIGLQNRLKSKI